MSGNQPNCGTNNIGGIAGAAGAAGAANSGSCAQLTALRSCLNAFCASASNPFCTCYVMGADLDATNCPSCKPFDAQKFCTDQANTGAEYDCSAATGAVATACIGVQ